MERNNYDFSLHLRDTAWLVNTDKFRRKLSHPSLQTYTELILNDTAFGASSKFIPIVSTAPADSL